MTTMLQCSIIGLAIWVVLLARPSFAVALPGTQGETPMCAVSCLVRAPDNSHWVVDKVCCKNNEGCTGEQKPIGC